MLQKLRLEDLPLNGKKVLMRVDYNVPMKDGKIIDDSRIKATLPSINKVLEKGGALILMSHLGRPEGKKESRYSLQPIAKRLCELLHQSVLFASDCIGDETQAMAKKLKPKEVLLLENLRFYPAEEDPKQDPSFAKELSSLADFYVDDAFGAAHRAHSSITEVPRYFPGKAAAGCLLQKELSFLSSILEHPKRPFFAIIGGSKLSSKMGVVLKLLEKVDLLFLGGGMAFPFLKAEGIPIGRSISEDEMIPKIQKLLKEKKIKEKIRLPVDLVIADSFKNDAATKVVSTPGGVLDNWQGMDIGPKTCIEWEKELRNGSTIFWNGPLGVYEFPRFSKGTDAIAKTLSELSATTIAGGGDSIASIERLHLADRFTHISTGGGASLELIELGHLPGIDVLSPIAIKK
jgi:phosphoglycerate kinase